MAFPGIWRSAALSLWIGLAAGLLSFLVVIGAVIAALGTPWFERLSRACLPVLALPHVAAALGLAFLLAPSGWIVRALSPGLTGWTLPPDWATVQDPYGLAAILCLTLKESAYLLLMVGAALGQIPAQRSLNISRSLGHDPARAVLLGVLPQLYPLIRLPVYAILAYGISTLEIALILGPTTPPTLAVLVLQGFSDPDLSAHLPAAAGAILQLILVVIGLGLWWLGERACVALARRWSRSGPAPASARQGWRLSVGREGYGTGIVLCLVLAAGVLLALALWSVTWRWPWPEPWPTDFSLRLWLQQESRLLWLLQNSLSVALASTALALILALGCLEYERRLDRHPSRWVEGLIYLPLLVPQIGFLFGVQVFVVAGGLDGGLLAVTLLHLLFVLPYVYLALAGPYRRLDPRYARTAQCLGAGANRQFWRVVLPLIARPILFAAAIGIAVSTAQYLPTLFAGGGRVPTLTTEAVSLAAGADRRLIGL
ncbi:MAG: ABC transporter permease, partial [Rhodospirillaceae bacterium]